MVKMIPAETAKLSLPNVAIRLVSVGESLSQDVLVRYRTESNLVHSGDLASTSLRGTAGSMSPGALISDIPITYNIATQSNAGLNSRMQLISQLSENPDTAVRVSLPARISDGVSEALQASLSCYHQILVCDAIVENGKVQSTQNCTPSPFFCKKTEQASCNSVEGIGVHFRSENALIDAVKSTISLFGEIDSDVNYDVDPQYFNTSNIPNYNAELDALQRINIKAYKKTPIESISIDAVLLFFVFGGFLTAIFGSIAISIMNRSSAFQDRVRKRRLRWDPVQKYTEAKTQLKKSTESSIAADESCSPQINVAFMTLSKSASQQ
ncbi:hypothetical protein HDU97_001662 [Phlyctochytrium planicorne]|nr:hypothetical protein HDU97_001662 [Phlyctochytrium planicorne]